MNATVDTFDGQFDSQRQYSQLQDAIASRSVRWLHRVTQ